MDISVAGRDRCPLMADVVGWPHFLNLVVRLRRECQATRPSLHAGSSWPRKKSPLKVDIGHCRC